MFAETLKRERREVFQEGEIKGKLEGKLETAIKLYNAGAEISFIANITELPKNEIKDLIKNHRV